VYKPLFAVVAGIRSGAGPVDCESDTWITSPNARVLTRLSRQCKQSGVRAHTSLFTSSPTYINVVYSSVNSIAQTAAWQLQRTDIRVNAVCPGLIETGMTALVFDNARQRGTADKIGQLNPMGRYGVAEGTPLLSIQSDDRSCTGYRDRERCPISSFRSVVLARV
jgi:hypothetical protein